MLKYAKTLYKPTRPKDMNEEINSYTNNPLPHFFKYAKDKKERQITPVNLSFVNKLETMIPNPRLRFKNIGLDKIDYALMMNNPDIEFDLQLTDNGRVVKEETDPVIVKYCEFDKLYYLSLDSALCSSGNDRSDAYMRLQTKLSRIVTEIRSTLSQCGRDEDEVVDILVKYLYGNNRKNKTALWLCYGDVIYRNLSEKLKYGKKEVQCVDCGEWFEVKVCDSETIRCASCRAEHLKRIKSEQNRRAYQKRKSAKMQNNDIQ